MRKKILITGANGCIGKNLVEFYSSRAEVIPVYRNDDVKQIIYNCYPNTIIHCSAEIYDASKMFEANVEYSKKIIDCGKSLVCPPKLVFLGSSSEYGHSDAPMKESDLIKPSTPYAITKAWVSYMLKEYHMEYGNPAILVRPFSIVGKYEKSHKFFPTLYRAYRDKLPITVCEAAHDFLFVQDFVNQLDVVINNFTTFDIVNIGSGYQTLNSEIVQLFEKVTGYQYEKQEVDRMREFDSMNWKADISKLQEKYGIEPIKDRLDYLEQGISKFIKDCEAYVEN